MGIFPAPAGAVEGFASEGLDGVFQQYCARVQPVSVAADVRQLRAGAADPVKMGKETAIMPPDTAFEHAALWKIHVPPVEDKQVARLLLSIDYVGDIARVYAGDRFVTDDFYYGAPLEVGLWRTGHDVELQILPLRGDAPIYLPAGTRIPAGKVAAEVKSVQVILEYEAILRIR